MNSGGGQGHEQSGSKPEGAGGIGDQLGAFADELLFDEDTIIRDVLYAARIVTCLRLSPLLESSS